MAISWFPLQAGQKITADMLNEMIASIQDGSIFTSAAFVSDLVTTLDSRVDTLEAKMSVVEVESRRSFIREQFILTSAQSSVPLSKSPELDSEHIFLNGMALAKDDIPDGVGGDYFLTGSTLNFVNDLALQIEAGDRLVVQYAYEVV